MSSQIHVTNLTADQQERFASLSPIYYRHARAVLLCFSIDDRKSLVSLLTRFLPEVCNSFKSNSPEDQPVMYLLGLKSDLEGKREVSTTEAKVRPSVNLTRVNRYFSRVKNYEPILS